MSTSWKTIRVFISSTFRDMQAERDHLVRFVFPRLREELLKWCIHLEDVDLRWGVTSDQDAFDLCMKEIDLCHPRFICMLGWRYGWVPPPKEIPAEFFVKVLDGKSAARTLAPAERETLRSIYSPIEVGGKFHLKQKPKTTDELKAYRAQCEVAVSVLQRAGHDEAKLSITASEIHHGALERLNIPAFRSFYIRKGNPTDKIPATYIEEPGTLGVAYLRDLKAKIKDPATKGKVLVSPGHEEFRPLTCHDYPWDWDEPSQRITQLEKFGKLVHADIIASVKAEFGDIPEYKPAVTDEEIFEEEAQQMEAFIEERTRPGRYVASSRDKLLLPKLETFAAADSTPNILVLTGAPGSGKSAFLAKFVRELPSQLSTIAHFIGVSAGSTDLRRTLRRLCNKLAPLADNTEPLPQDIKELIPHFQKLLTEAAKKQRIVLILDALNQFDTNDGAHWMNWLPSNLPPNVRILASVITPPEGQPERQTLAILRTRKARIEPLEPLEEHDSRAILTDFLDRYSKHLTEAQIAAILAKPEGNLPLYLLVVLEELRTLGTDEQLTALSTSKIPPDELARLRRDDHDKILEIFIDQLPGDALGLFVWILKTRLSQDQFLSKDPKEAADLVGKFAACLGVSRHGLSPAELAALLDPGDPLGNIAALLRLLRPYLMRRGELLDFYHGQFREAAVTAHLDTPEKQRAAHQSVATCLQAFADPHRDGQCRDATPHALSELPHHQTRAEAWPELIATLENIFFLEAKVTHGMAFDLAEDFTAAVDGLPPEHIELQRLRLLEEALRRDLHFIARHAKDYPQCLFQCLWNSAWWYDCPDAALHYLDPENGWKQPPPWKSSDRTESVSGLLERWRREREAAYVNFSWLRTLRPPAVRLNAGQLAIFRGHEGAVTSVAFSPDGRHLLSGAWDKTLRIWDARTGRELVVLRGHENEVTSVAFSPDGHRALSGSKDNTVRLWDTGSGKCLEVLSERIHDVSSVKFSPDGEQLLIGMGHQVRVRYPRRGRIGVLLWGPEISMFCEHTAKVTSVAFSPDGSRVLSGTADHMLRLWDSRLRRTANSFFFGYLAGVELLILQGHADKVTSVAFSPDGERIVSGSADKTLRLWNAHDGRELTVLHGHEGTVTSVAFSPDSEKIVSSSEDMTLRLWNARDGRELAVFRGHENIVTSAAFSPDGHRVLSGAGEKTLRLWNAQDWQQPPVLREHMEWVKTAAFSPDGERLVSGSFDNTLRFWDVRSGRELAVLRGHRSWVVSVAFSPDGSRVASGSGDNTVRLWDANSGRELAVMRGHEQMVESVAFSPDGSRLLSRSFDGTLRLWDATDGKCLEILRGHEDLVKSDGVAFSPDGSRLISREKDGTLRDVRSGEYLEVPLGKGSLSLHVVEPPVFPWRMETGFFQDEVVVICPADGRPVAWFSSKFSDIFVHPEGRIWAGTKYQIKHHFLLQLEGG